jgi:hypothetical protein
MPSLTFGDDIDTLGWLSLKKIADGAAPTFLFGPGESGSL